MGFINSPSWAQSAMEELLADIQGVEVYIDDIGIFSNNYDDHLQTLDKVLNTLKMHNFTVKASKCHFATDRAPYLGHIITSNGILPNPDKIKPILQLEFPKTVTEL